MARLIDRGMGDGKSRERQSARWTRKVKLLSLLLIVLIAAPIVLATYLYYLPLSDIEAKPENPHWAEDDGYYSISGWLNVTNKGLLTHVVRFTVSVVFDSQPDKVFAWSGWGDIPPTDWTTGWGPHFYVYVPSEVVGQSYNASCSVSLFPAINDYSIPWIVLPGVIWLVSLAAVVTALARSRRN